MHFLPLWNWTSARQDFLRLFPFLSSIRTRTVQKTKVRHWRTHIDANSNLPWESLLFAASIIWNFYKGKLQKSYSVWKSPKMSHLILVFSTNFCPIKSGLSGNTSWLARFARNVEWDFFLFSNTVQCNSYSVAERISDLETFPFLYFHRCIVRFIGGGIWTHSLWIIQT